MREAAQGEQLCIRMGIRECGTDHPLRVSSRVVKYCVPVCLP
jgi:hypothetical protein